MPRFNLPSLFIAVLTLLAPPLAAAETGSVSGRVLNQPTNRYVNQARVSLTGTALQTFTDEAGAYLLNGIPAGPATVVVT
ncbi:MAG: carboxypeptidase regulatory-like domain-containing protein, partial [Opitutaceae bacterium]